MPCRSYFANDWEGLLGNKTPLPPPGVCIGRPPSFCGILLHKNTQKRIKYCNLTWKKGNIVICHDIGLQSFDKFWSDELTFGKNVMQCRRKHIYRWFLLYLILQKNTLEDVYQKGPSVKRNSSDGSNHFTERVKALNAFCASDKSRTRKRSPAWERHWWYSSNYNFLYCMVLKV